LIDLHTTTGASADNDRARQTLDRLPSPKIRPATLFELLNVRPDHTDAVIDILRRDAVLAARVLAVVNSAALGVAHEVARIDRAVYLLGAGRARSIGLAHGLGLLAGGMRLPRRLADALWIGAVTKACAASLFMQHTAGEMAERAFAAGLIQDVGLPMLAAADGDWYRNQLLAGQVRQSWTAAELERFGLDHAAVGRRLLESWDAPQPLIASVARHHRPLGDLPEGDDEALLDIAVFTAGLLSHAWELPAESTRHWLGAIHARFLADRYPTPDVFVRAAGEEARRIMGRVPTGPAAPHPRLNRDTLEQAGDDIIRTVTQLCRMEGRLLRQRAGFEELRRKAYTDALTRTLNRRGFTVLTERRLRDALHADAPICCMMIDVDNFKDINDTFGHRVGDRVLRAVGRKLRRSVRRQDVIGRIGGDEFALFITHVSAEEADRFAHMIGRAIAGTRIRVCDETLNVQASIGVVHAGDARPMVRIDTLLDAADAAMYQSKQMGKGQVHFTRADAAKLTGSANDHEAA